ncbi:hypothetical protein SERLA73DRAFT_168593 [Serpula lacrymans var. lacrymans S7.3]|uniref:Uncharacterized protein n=2 Tax=Serpula lacrymans var. lacrymans TaxID=341189 RepID=F8PYS6_SERL3|nr:uncharacterized protein SERLADRAFT_449380 [Serpula lacrymans var. lacrymans S7.9]EGN99039.1 hypothetical protein SERLA73DRAFT_168593 [Serpula lacrymans var. lacrymans S7.3]EGO24614.1 hypothetical protein SERLADRAFT_449380 [Serpula lacrymans var. lacrymans S7.9]
MRKVFWSAIVLWASWVQAQTATVVDGAGYTVVEVVTIDPALGLPTTEILRTLTGTGAISSPTSSTTPLLATTPTSTAALTTTTTAAQQQGPVGQPAPTQAQVGGPTPYTYTTTDADGNTETLLGTFIPTGPESVLPTPTTTGTILDYSSWLGLVGTNTLPAQSSARVSWQLSGGWFGVMLGTLMSIVAGLVLV